MFVIVLDCIRGKGISYFGGISNELRAISCDSLDACVHYNDIDIANEVCSVLCSCDLNSHVEVVK